MPCFVNRPPGVPLAPQRRANASAWCAATGRARCWTA